MSPTARLEDVSFALNAYSVLASDQQSFADLLELRMAIEGDAAAKVAARNDALDWRRLEARLEVMARARILEEFAIHDIDFHMDVLRLSGNELFASLGSALRDRYVRFAIDAMDSYRGADHLRGETMNEHRLIVDAIASGDTDGARQAARRHVIAARGRWSETHGDDAGHETSGNAGGSPRRKRLDQAQPGCTDQDRRAPSRRVDSHLNVMKALVCQSLRLRRSDVRDRARRRGGVIACARNKRREPQADAATAAAIDAWQELIDLECSFIGDLSRSAELKSAGLAARKFLPMSTTRSTSSSIRRNSTPTSGCASRRARA